MAPEYLAELLGLTSFTPIQRGVCLHKCQPEGISDFICCFSQNQALWATMIQCTFNFIAFFLLQRNVSPPEAQTLGLE